MEKQSIRSSEKLFASVVCELARLEALIVNNRVEAEDRFTGLTVKFEAAFSSIGTRIDKFEAALAAKAVVIEAKEKGSWAKLLGGKCSTSSLPTSMTRSP